MNKLTVLVSVISLVGASSTALSSEKSSPDAGARENVLDDTPQSRFRLNRIDPDIIRAQADDCRDRITQVREASGQEPSLEREPASPDRPYAIYAVHREQDGCSVMVMMGNPDDIRPLPGPMAGPTQIIPADADQ